MPLPRTIGKSRQDFFTVYLDGFSRAELVHISELASAAEIPTATAAVHAAWANWGSPRQPSKEVINQDDLDVLGSRVSGTLGRISLPGNSSWPAHCFVVVVFARMSLAPSSKDKFEGGRRVRAFQFRRELSSIFTSFWDSIHPEGLRAHRRLLSESMFDDVLLAILSLLVCVRSARQGQPACGNGCL